MTTRARVTALAEHLAAEGVGAWPGPYSSSDTGIVVGSLPSTPAAVIGLTPYPISDALGTSAGLHAVQIRMRTGSRSPGPVLDLQDAVHAALHGRRYLNLGGPVTLTWRQISAALGEDDNGRYEVADTYYLHTNEGATG